MNKTNRTINSNEQFISTIIPLIEEQNPGYACEGLLSVPLAIYYGKKNGEYVFDLLYPVSDVAASATDFEDVPSTLDGEQVGPY